MRTLVIGGTRNLGPDLVQALLARGDEVTVLNRGLTPAALPPAVHRLTADRTDPAALHAALSAAGDFDLVVDTMLYTGAEARVIAELCAGRTGRYVWWSTGQVYLVRDGAPRPFRESDYDGPLLPEPAPEAALDLRNWRYGIGKRDAEDVFRVAFAERGFPVISLRMPMIASERDHYTRIAAYVRRLLDGGAIIIPDNPPLPVRHVYGRDVIAATLRAADAPGAAGQAFNISQDETLELFDLIGRIGTLLSRSPRYLAVPLTELLTSDLLPACSPFSDPWMSSLANDLSRLALGMTYTPVRDYLPRCVEAALRLLPEQVLGYDKRPLEMELEKGG